MAENVYKAKRRTHSVRCQEDVKEDDATGLTQFSTVTASPIPSRMPSKAVGEGPFLQRVDGQTSKGRSARVQRSLAALSVLT